MAPQRAGEAMIARRARSWARLSGTWAALALACPTWAGESIDFFDGDFTTDWVYSQVTAGNGGSASMSVQGGGVPGSCVVAETHVNEDCGAIYAFAFKSSATYDPSSQGALASLNYSEDAKLIDGFGSGQATGPAIQQGGRLYVLPQFPTGTDTNWHHMARGGLTASAFIEVVGGGCPDYIDLGSHPDFSETGPTMTFGYFRANSQLDDFPEYSITAAIDNWFVSLGPIVYVALGDSFSAGEGVPAFFPDSHTSSNKCHRSMRAYGFKISFSGVHLDPVEFLACSGAETFNISGGIPPGNAPFEPAQLARIYPPPRSGTIVSDDTDMVTLTVGGNDLGFEEILTKCTLQLFPSCDSEAYHPHSGSIKSLRQIVGETLPLVDSRAAGTYAAIKSQTENGAAVFVLGYPTLFGDGDCPATVDAAFSPSERQWLDSLADSLNARLALAAAASGVHFVEVMTTFQGHGVCSPSPWVNAFNGPKYGWFHPTAMGQLMYGKRLTRPMKDWVTQQKPLVDTGLPANPSGFAAASAPDVPVDVPPSLGSLIVQPAGTAPCSMGDTYVPGQLVLVSGNRFGAGQVVTLRLLAGAYAASVATAAAP